MQDQRCHGAVRTKICDIDILLTVGTSSVFNNVIQTVHVLMTLLHFTCSWCHTTDGIGIKKGNYWFYMDQQGHIYAHVDSLPGFQFHFIKW